MLKCKKIDRCRPSAEKGCSATNDKVAHWPIPSERHTHVILVVLVQSNLPKCRYRPFSGQTQFAFAQFVIVLFGQTEETRSCCRESM